MLKRKLFAIMLAAALAVPSGSIFAVEGSPDQKEDLNVVEAGIANAESRISEIPNHEESAAVKTEEAAGATEASPTLTDIDSLSARIRENDPEEYILQEGTVPATIYHYDDYKKGVKSMADGALVKPMRVIRTNKGYKAIITLQGLTILDQKAYLGKLYQQDPASPADSTNFKELVPISYYDVIDVYNDPQSGLDPIFKGKKYPKEFVMPVKLTAEHELIQVYVPVMEGLQAGGGTKKARLLADGNDVSWGALYTKSLTDRLDRAAELKQGTKSTAAFKELRSAIEAGREAVEKIHMAADLDAAIQAIDRAVKRFTEAAVEAPEQQRRFVRLNVSGLPQKELEQAAIKNMLDDIAEIVEKDGQPHLRLTYFSKAENEAGYDSGTSKLEYSDEYIAEADSSKRTLVTDVKVIESGQFDGPYELSQTDIPLAGRDHLYLYGYFKTLNTTDAPRWEYCAIVTWKNSEQQESTQLSDLKILNVKQRKVRLINQAEATHPLDFQGRDGRWYSPYNSKNRDKFMLPSDPGSSETQINLARESFVIGGLRKITYTIDGTEPAFDSPAAEIKSLNQDPYLPDKFYRITFLPAQIQGLPKTGGDLQIRLKGFRADGKESTKTHELTIPFQPETVDKTTNEAEVPGSSFTVTADTAQNYAFKPGTKILAELLTEEEMLTVIRDLLNKTGAKNPHFLRLALVDEEGKAADLMHPNGWQESVYPLARLQFNINDKKLKAKDLAIYEYSFGRLRQISSENNISTKYLRANISQPEGYYVIAELNANEQNKFAKDRLNKVIETANALLNGTSDNAIILKNTVQAAQNELARSGRRKPRTGEMLALANRIEELVSLIQQESADPTAFDLERAQSLIKLAEQAVIKEFASKAYLDKLLAAATDLKTELAKSESTAIVSKTEALQTLLSQPESRYPERQATIKMLKQRDDSQSMSDNVFVEEARLIEGAEANYLLLDLKTLVFGNIRGHLLKLTMHTGDLDTSDVYPVSALNKMMDIGMHGKKSLFDSKLVIKIDNPAKEIYQVRVDSDAMSGANPAARMKLTLGDTIKSLDRTSLAEALAEAGQIKQADKTAGAFRTLQQAIKLAEKVQAEAVDQDQLNEALAGLKAAIEEFKASPNEKEETAKKPELDPSVRAPEIWTTGEQNARFIIKITAPLSNLLTVKLDGQVLGEDDYVASSGSTVLELKGSYLNSLAAGRHSLAVVYKAGEPFAAGVVEHAFEVKAAASTTSPTPTKEPLPTQATENTPKTIPTVTNKSTRPTVKTTAPDAVDHNEMASTSASVQKTLTRTGQKEIPFTYALGLFLIAGITIIIYRRRAEQ